MRGAALVIVMALVGGCAAHIPVKPIPVSPYHFWNGCQEVVMAEPDGYQHFVCVDKGGREWDVTVRLAKR